MRSREAKIPIRRQLVGLPASIAVLVIALARGETQASFGISQENAGDVVGRTAPLHSSGEAGVVHLRFQRISLPRLGGHTLLAIVRPHERQARVRILAELIVEAGRDIAVVLALARRLVELVLVIDVEVQRRLVGEQIAGLEPVIQLEIVFHFPVFRAKARIEAVSQIERHRQDGVGDGGHGIAQRANAVGNDERESERIHDRA